MNFELVNASLALGGKELFAHLSFTLPAGQMLCLRGQSGCGKSSLLKALLGFVPLTAGFVSIDGEPMTQFNVALFRRRMAYLPQELSLPADTVAEMVRLPFALQAHADKQFNKQALLEEWERLGLAPELYDKKVAEVSGGERQRIMLAVAAQLGADIVLADEPTSALDAEARDRAAQCLKRMAQAGAAVVVVSHDDAVAAVADQQLVVGQNTKVLS